MVSFGGLASGLDTNAIIRQLLALEARPLNRLEQQRATLVAKQGSISEFRSKLKTFSDSISALGDSKELTIFKTTSSDEDVATVSAEEGAIPGSYTLNVTALAKAKSTSYESPFADSDQSTFGDGTIDITVGSNTVQVSVDSSDTLEDIRDAINDADAGVNASVIYDGSAYQLVVTSEETGVANGFTLTAAGFNDPGETDPFAVSTALTAATDAAFSINGLPITASANDAAGAIDGITFELKSLGTTEVTIDRDQTAIGDRVQETLDAYNDVLDFINAQSDSNDVSLRGIKNQLSSAVATTLSSGSFSLVALSQIGVSTDSAGKLKLDRGDLESALDTDFDAVIDLFAGDGAGTDGLAKLFKDILEGNASNSGILSPGDGALKLRETILGDRIRAIDSQIDVAEARLDRTEQSLVRRFASFEQLTAQYQAQGSFLSASLQR